MTPHCQAHRYCLSKVSDGRPHASESQSGIALHQSSVGSWHTEGKTCLGAGAASECPCRTLNRWTAGSAGGFQIYAITHLPTPCGSCRLERGHEGQHLDPGQGTPKVTLSGARHFPVTGQALAQVQAAPASWYFYCPPLCDGLLLMVCLRASQWSSDCGPRGSKV